MFLSKLWKTKNKEYWRRFLEKPDGKWILRKCSNSTLKNLNLENFLSDRDDCYLEWIRCTTFWNTDDYIVWNITGISTLKIEWVMEVVWMCL
jgi:hypothetical protein